MKGRWRWERAFLLAVGICFWYLQIALAAPLSIVGVRFGSTDEHDRMVVDVSTPFTPNTWTEDDGKTIVVEIPNADSVPTFQPFHDDIIQKVTAEQDDKGTLRIRLYLTKAFSYHEGILTEPARLYVDIEKQAATSAGENTEERELAEGLHLLTYTRNDARGKLTAYIVDADPAHWRAVPVLAQGEVPGRETVANMAKDIGATVAINANYFAPSGDILGLLKINGQLVGTTYFIRSGVGFDAQGKTTYGQLTYNGQAVVNGVSHVLDGVDAEREENALVLYNHWYGKTTGTNAYGIEYTVENGKITHIQKSDSEIPDDGYVLSAHGTAAEDLEGAQVGDTVTLTPPLGDPWDALPNIIGAGPRLVEHGKTHVTSIAEEFPADIAKGRAPRTAFGTTADGHYLLAVVEGRQEHSDGCTLLEMADLMRQFGAVEAVNFDGGGSSEIVAQGEILNKPSDGTERPVGSALALLPR